MAISVETAGGSARPGPANGGYREHYIRDAQGNIMATYRFNPASLVLNDRPLYGSSRLGNYTKDLQLYYYLPGGQPPLAIQQGELNYELTDHLGNVSAVVTGNLITNLPGVTPCQAQLVSAQGYEPFGALLPGRNYNTGSYRFGFQGQIKDDEIYGATGTNYAFEYRMHDPRVGRFWSIDPLAAKYPEFSPYSFSGNRLLDAFELEGLEPIILVNTKKNPGDAAIRDAGLRETDQSAIHLFGHGNNSGFRDDNGAVRRIQTAAQFETWLQQKSETWQYRKEGESIVIVLHSCDNGRVVQGRAPFAQRASSLPGVTLVAPDDWDYYLPDREMGPRRTEGLGENHYYISDGKGGHLPTTTSGPANWNVYRHGDLMKQYPGDKKLVGTEILGDKDIDMMEEVISPSINILERDGQSPQRNPR